MYVVFWNILFIAYGGEDNEDNPFGSYDILIGEHFDG